MIFRQSFGVLLVALLWNSCAADKDRVGQEPAASIWPAVAEAYRLGRYERAVDLLDKLSRDPQHADLAQPWRMVVIDGMLRARSETADHLQREAMRNPREAVHLAREAEDLRLSASQLALRFTEGLHWLVHSPAAFVVLDFPLPAASVETPVSVVRLHPRAGTIENFEVTHPYDAMEGVLRAAQRAAGVSSFPQGPVRVPREVFCRAMADSSLAAAELFSSDRLDMPERYHFFCRQARALSRQLNDSQQTRTLITRIDAAARKMKKG